VELLTRLDALVRLAETGRELEASREAVASTAAIDPASGLITRSNLERQSEQALSHARRHRSEVSALMVGFDGFDELVGRHGASVGERLLGQLAKLLQKSVRREDTLARYDASQFAVISPSTGFKASTAFGVRLREAVETATVNYRGEALCLTVSIGVSNNLADKAETGEALLQFARERMQRARASGGNRVIGDSEGAVARDAMPTLEHALGLIRAGDLDALRPHLPALAGQLLPLLRLIDAEYRLGLPLAEIVRVLKS
jgi:diguanylate cyclase (GGDEF)-like protein